MIDYDPLEGYRDAEGYDVEDGGYDADVALTERLAREQGGAVLDLACGTGTMAIRLARQGFAVTGLDIVPEMLAWAGAKAAKEDVAVEWVLADARSFHLGRRFGLISMLGNAFQHMLTRADHEALFARALEHLDDGGCLLFCTRNPSPRNLSHARYTEPRTYTLPDGRRYVSIERQEYDPIAQIQHYTFTEEWLEAEGTRPKQTTRTALRYIFPQEMEALLHYNGLRVRARYGGWQGEPLTADARQMIYVCERRG